MGTKEKVLELLRENEGMYLSGQEIADSIYVTRASVWKAIKSLKEKGYDIDAITNKGYRLRSMMDTINTGLIERSLSESGLEIEVLYFDEVTSTNDLAIEYANDSQKCTLVIADSQTRGRGRRGRDFYSPKATGLYMSIAIHPGSSLSEIAGITAKAAVATAKSIDNIVFNGTDTTSIKWVNDIFINDRKVSGILSEAHVSLEDAEDTYVVVGFGINVFAPDNDFPKEIRDIAGTLMTGHSPENKNVRSLLAAEIVKLLFYYLENDNDESLDIYRKKSFLIGSYIKINSFNSANKYAFVTGIDENYHLCVRYDDGSEDVLSSGEVSVVKY